jgi:hypothetical protein
MSHLFGSAVQHQSFADAVGILFSNLCKDPKLAEMLGTLLAAISTDTTVVKVAYLFTETFSV